jgi:outer membrane putative beta-barrel porin/alpha-amylase
MCAQRDAVRVFAAVTAAILSLPLTPTSARAQNLPLAQLLPDLVLREIVLQSTTMVLTNGNLTHTAHFSPIEANELNNPVVGIVQAFNTQMATQFSTFPLGSSTGGLTYVFDEALGTFRRGSSSFGPLFAERALTIGRRKLSAGFNYQRTSYDTFEGQNLDDGSIKFYLRHQDCCTGSPTAPLVFQPNGTRLSPPFEGDLIEAALSLKATTHTTAAFANYGVTDRWDVGLAVPFVRVNLDASVRARILRQVTGLTGPLPPGFTEADRQAALNTHTFELNNPNATRTVQHSGHASGLGDVVLRTKYRFLGTTGGGLAAAVDLRLPTGDKNELLGAGGTEAKFLLIASSESAGFGQHVNIGYTAAHGNLAGTVAGLSATSLPDEINYTGGVEFVANPRLTLMGDVIGRTLRGTGRLDLVSKSFEYNDPRSFFFPPPGPGCAGFPGFTCRSVSLDEFAPRPGNLTLLLGTGGVKFNLAGNLLISGSVLFPLTNAGLRSRLTTVIGVDYAF